MNQLQGKYQVEPALEGQADRISDSLIEDIVSWDVVNWSRAIEYWSGHLEKWERDLGRPLKCLEIGARNGGLSLWLSLRGHEVLCTDVEDPKDKASLLHLKYPQSKGITYRAVDATNMSFVEEFDLIIFKSVLGGINFKENLGSQREVMEGVYRALKPKGIVLFAENARSFYLLYLARRYLTAWGHRWKYFRESELRELFSSFSKIQVETTGFLAAFGFKESLRVVLGKMDQRLFQNTTPRSWKYIQYGVAEK